MPYSTPQREIPALCYTFSRWIRGTFHLGRPVGLDDHLRKLRTFFPVTDVDLGTGPLPFLAVRTSALHAVVPTVPEADLLLEPRAGTVPGVVSCYLENLAVHGTLELMPGVRTSDFLGIQEGFIALRRCRLVPSPDGLVEPVPVVFVNAGAIIAVAEEAASPPGEASKGEGI